ncbi:MAG: cytochrome c peroxidase [Bradymonadia bacterium]
MGLRPTNNGLDALTTDDGSGAVTGRQQDDSLFRTPALRNIATRAPFIHDGRFTTLEQVVRHYSNGVQNHPNRSPPLRGNAGPNLARFSDAEVDSVVAFLETLTDLEMLAAERFSDPFLR